MHNRLWLLIVFAVLVLSVPFTAYASPLTIISKPEASDIFYGQTISASTINPESALVQNSDGEAVTGAWVWQEPGITAGRVGSLQAAAVFICEGGTAVVPLSIQVLPAEAPNVEISAKDLLAHSPTDYSVDIDTAAASLDVYLKSSQLVLGDTSFGYKVSVRLSDAQFLDAFDVAGGTLAYGVEQPFTINFLPNNGITDRSAEIVFTFSQTSFNYQAVPLPITLRIHQPVDLISVSDKIAANLESVVSSDLNFPRVEIIGNTAKLIYDGLDLPIEITVPDISRLEADIPYPLKELRSEEVVLSKSELMLPAIVVNDVLGKKADSIAALADSIVFVQSDEELTTYDVELAPEKQPDFPAGVSFSLEDFSFTLKSPSSLSVTTDIQTVRAYVKNGFDYPLFLTLYYNGVPASQKLEAVVPFSNSEAFAVSLNADLNMLSDPVLETAVDLTPAQAYDPESGHYITYTKSGREVRSTVPNGLITNGTAAFFADNTVKLVLYKDDQEIAYSSGQEIKDPGSYRIEITDFLSVPDTSEYENMDDEQLAALGEAGLSDNYINALSNIEAKDKVLCFRILGSEVRGLKFYNAPAGFTISQGIFNDTSMPVNGLNNHAYPLAEDGFYAFLLTSDTSGAQISVKFTLDNTPALIWLDGITNFVGTSPVRLSAIDPSTTVDVRINAGGSVQSNDGEYAQNGVYEVYASDPAGNTTKYMFQILYSMNLSGYSVFLLAFVSIAGLGGYLIYLRRNIRVR